MKPVTVRPMTADYIQTEYGLTKEEADRAIERLRTETGKGPYQTKLRNLEIRNSGGK